MMASASAPNLSELTHRESPSHPTTDWRAWLTALAFGLAAFALFTRHNDFPFYYHTDEPSKVQQVLTKERNFHHPLLLLESTEVALVLTGAARDPQSVVEAGRTVSAFYAALAVVALTLLAWSHGGPIAAGLAGTLLATHPVLFELAHYMKEDCSLLAGVAVCFLGLQLYSRRPTLLRAALTGAAAGLACSSKLIGVVIAIVALLVVLATPRHGARGDWRAAAIFLGAALLVFGFINADALRQLAGVRGGLDNELKRIDEGTDERQGTLQIKYLSKFGRVISWPLLLGACFWIYHRWRQRRAQSLATWALIAFPLLFAAALSVAPVTKERYLLPVFALFCVLGALGIVELAALRPFRRARVAAGALAALALAWHLPKLVTYHREFSLDDRRDLAAWIRENLPPTATIIHDRRVRFDYAQKDGLPIDRIPQQTRRPRRFLHEFGTLAELRAQGVKYAVLCEPDYASALRPREKKNQRLDAAQQFYQQVMTEGRQLWARPSGHIFYLRPGLQLYELP